MLGAAAALGAPALLRATPAAAQAAAAAPAAPGFFRFRLGEFTVTSLHDGSRLVPLQGLVRNAPLEEVQRTLAEGFQPTDQLRITFTGQLVDTGRALVLLDTGNGPQAAGAPIGRMAGAMQAAGIDPARITHVVISHFHPDHINGLTQADGSAAFPNAEVLVPEAEWRFWTDEGAASRAPAPMQPLFANVTARFRPYQGRIRQGGDGTEAAAGISLLAAPGHTPGHAAVQVASGAETMVYIADTTNRPELNARRPDFHFVFDMDPVVAEATRRRLLDRISAERLRVAGFHFPFPGAGNLAKDGNGYRFSVVDWATGV